LNNDYFWKVTAKIILTENQKGKLRRVIRPWELSFNLVNIIIGAGIFVLPAIVAAGLGSASILAYLLCGVVITLVMLCFAEVGSYVTDSGGAYAYIERAFGKYFGFLTAILFVVAVISANAAIANAIVDIIGSVFPLFQLQVVKIIFFFVLFLSLGYINVLGVKQGIGLVKGITIIKLLPLLLIIVVGFGEINVDYLKWSVNPSFKEVGEMAIILFFAFQGAESGLSVSGEVKHPQKAIPKAIFMGILLVLIVYILLQTISQGLLGPSLPSFVENPLGEVAGKIFGPLGFGLITIGAALSMFGSISGSVLSIPRIIYGAANDKAIPIPILASIHKKYSTPHIAIILYATLGFLFASFGGFKQLAILASASVLLIYLGVALSVIKLRKNVSPEIKAKSFIIPGGYTVPIISAAAIVFFLSNLSKNELLGIGIFLLILSFIYMLIFSKWYENVHWFNR